MKRVIVVILNFEISNALTRYNFWSTNTNPKVSEACELIKIIFTDKKINKYIEVYTVYIYILLYNKLYKYKYSYFTYASNLKLVAWFYLNTSTNIVVIS